MEKLGDLSRKTVTLIFVIQKEEWQKESSQFPIMESYLVNNYLGVEDYIISLTHNKDYVL